MIVYEAIQVLRLNRHTRCKQGCVIDIFGIQVHYMRQNTPSELFSTRYEQNSGRNTGTEAVKTVKNSKFQIHVNGLKILKSKKSCLLRRRRILKF